MRALAVACALLAAATRVAAHDVPLEQIVPMFVSENGADLVVLARIPTALLADANLPKSADGYLILADIDPAVRLVAADLARSLELEQDDVALVPGRMLAVLSAPTDTAFASAASARAHLRAGATVADQRLYWSQAFVDVELDYTLAAGGGRTSARLNLFRAPGQTVRTLVAYERPPTVDRTFSLAGPPERVTFDPDRGDAARGFVVRGLGVLLDGGDWLLFLVCVALPLRSGRQLRSIITAMTGGQVTGLAAAAMLPPLSPAARLAVELIASSAVLIAALQNVVDVRVRWARPVALLFGLVSGIAFAQRFHDAAAFAGSHVGLALAAFVAILVAGQLWFIAVLASVIGLLFRAGVPARGAAILASIGIAHTAVHWIADRGDQLGQTGAVTVEHALSALVVVWTALIVGAAVLDGLTGHHQGTLAPAETGGPPHP